MTIRKVWLLAFVSWACCLGTVVAQQHPINQLGQVLFESFRNKDFGTFYKHSVFSLDEDEFRSFLYGIRNDAVREKLTAGKYDNWKDAFARNWRKHWRHIATQPRNKVKAQAFDPILTTAAREGIQWETTELTGVEVLLPVTMKQRRFEVKRDFLDSNDSKRANPFDDRTLWFERGLAYRMRLDPSTHGYALMIGSESEDSKKRFDRGIRRNGEGVGDIVINFAKRPWTAGLDGESPLNLELATGIYESLTGKKADFSTVNHWVESGYKVKELVSHIYKKYFPSELFYFCPDHKGTGGSIRIIDQNDREKPNQRQDLILTFTFGQPRQVYQILIKEVLTTSRGPLFFEKPFWLGEPKPIPGSE